MPTIQQIIDTLPCLTSKQHKICPTCPFNPYPGREWVYGCLKGQNDVIAAAREALELLNRLEDDLK